MAQFSVPMKRGERLLLEGQFRAAQKQAVRDETDQRIRDHARRGRRSRAAARFRAAAQRSLDFLAVGDSWFDYPLDDSGWPSLYDHSMIGEYNLQAMGNPNPIILSFAHYGWASTQVLTYENQEQIIENAEDGGSWTNGTGPDAILASFGGDDIAGDQLAIYLTYGGQSNVPSTRFQGVLESVKASYQDLFALRDICAPKVPVFGQCYDYAIPDGIPANSLFGPWLKPSFDFALYDVAEATKVVHDMIDQFYQTLNDLASNPAYNFHLVDTRGTITADDWANELHPKSDGFNKLAQKLLAALQAYFPGQI
jgi:hypothetical protein